MSQDNETRVFDILNPKLSTVVWITWLIAGWSIFMHIYRWITGAQKEEDAELKKEIDEWLVEYQKELDAGLAKFCKEIDDKKEEEKRKDKEEEEKKEWTKYLRQRDENRRNEELSILKRWRY
jgi:Skp family chaperone for outer membrane proteins